MSVCEYVERMGQGALVCVCVRVSVCVTRSRQEAE